MVGHTVAGTEARRSPGGLRWAAPLLPIGLSVFGLSSLVYYHVRLGGQGDPSGFLQGVVAWLYGVLGFVPAFLGLLMVLVWSSIWFLTGRLERFGARAARVAVLVLSVAILVNLRGAAGTGPQGGELGAWLAARVQSVFGEVLSVLLVSSVAVAALLLATEFFFYRYFAGLGRGPAAGDQEETGVESEVTRELTELELGEAAQPRPRVRGVHAEGDAILEVGGAASVGAGTVHGTREVDFAETGEGEPGDEETWEESPHAGRSEVEDVEQEGLVEADEELEEEGRFVEASVEEEFEEEPEPAEEEEHEEEEEYEYEEEEDDEDEDDEEGEYEEEDYEEEDYEEEEYEEEDEREEDEDQGAHAESGGGIEPDASEGPHGRWAEAEFVEQQDVEPAGVTWEEVEEVDEVETEEQVVEIPAAADAESGTGERATRQGVLFGDDLVLDEAARLVLLANRASATFLQRRLRVSFDEARALLEQLRESGVVGGEPGEPHGPVLADLETWERTLAGRTATR